MKNNKNSTRAFYVEKVVENAVLKIQLSLVKIEGDTHNLKNHISNQESIHHLILEAIKNLNIKLANGQ